MAVRRGDSGFSVPADSTVREVDHRTVVGQRRRARTETRIILAAIEIFADQGPDTPIIDDFIRAAGIARGTFYNHFRSTAELLQATSAWLSEALIASIVVRIEAQGDGAMRFGLGLRIWMSWAQSNPSWSLFIARVWHLGDHSIPLRDLGDGIREHALSAPDPDVAWDVVAGAVREAMFRIGKESVPPGYGDAVASACLRALGLQPVLLARIMALPLGGPVDMDTLRQKASA